MTAGSLKRSYGWGIGRAPFHVHYCPLKWRQQHPRTLVGFQLATATFCNKAAAAAAAAEELFLYHSSSSTFEAFLPTVTLESHPHEPIFGGWLHVACTIL